MMHLYIVATLCFFKIISPRNYYLATRTIFPGSMFQSVDLNLTVANFFFVFYILDVKSFRTYRNINISNLLLSCGVEYGKNENEKSLLIKIVSAFYPLLSGEEISSHHVGWNMPKM